MKKIKYKTLSAGPDGIIHPDSTAVVSDEEAKILFESNCAELVEDIKNEPSEIELLAESHKNLIEEYEKAQKIIEELQNQLKEKEEKPKEPEKEPEKEESPEPEKEEVKTKTPKEKR